MRLPRTPDREKEDETGDGQDDDRSIASRNGAMNLVKAFEESLGIQVVADVGDKTDRYLYSGSRRSAPQRKLGQKMS